MWSIKGIFVFVLVFAFTSSGQLYARDSIALYQMGKTDPTLFAATKKYFLSRGYGVTSYEGTDTMEKQAQICTATNKEKGALFLAIEIMPAESEGVFLAITNAKKTDGGGALLSVEDVPGAHVEESEKLADALASLFGKKVKRLPLFPFLGIDRPGLFLHVDIPADKTGVFFDKLHNGIQKYLKRGVTNED